MKRKLLFGSAFVFIALAATSCEALSNCERCKTVIYDSLTGYVTEGLEETEYCGTELLSKKTKTYPNGNLRTTYKCR